MGGLLARCKNSEEPEEQPETEEPQRLQRTVAKRDTLVGGGVAPYTISTEALSDCMFMPKQDREGLLTKAGGAEGIARGLCSNHQTGLSTADHADLEKRLEVYGVNRLPPPKTKSLWSMIWEAATDKIMLLLLAAAIVSIALETSFNDRQTGWVEGTAIIIAVVIVVLITSLNNYSKERKFRELNAVKDDIKVTCMRDGVNKEISVYDILVGDILVIRTGSKLVADGILLEGFDIAMNESTATGESKEVRKGVTADGADRFFYSGTDCVLGEGRMMVISVGVNSFSGMTTMALRKGKEEQPETPLQQQLGVLAGWIGKAGMIVAGLLFVILVLQYTLSRTVNKQQIVGNDIGGEIVRFLITSLAIIVVAVPEGLPLAVTIALAFSMMRMLKDNNLVRNLDACETMGGATAVCTDKTGTLTQNKMTVVRAWMGDIELASIDGAKDFAKMVNPIVRDMACEGIVANSSADEQPNEKGVMEWIGSKTEVALLSFVSTFDVNYKDIRKTQQITKRWPFASARKRMSTALATSEERMQRIHMKGASEIVLELCSHMHAKDGSVVVLDDRMRRRLKMFIEDMASHALRTLCLAYCDISTGDARTVSSIQHKLDEPDSEMTLIGLFGIEDPLRPEAAAAVLDCQRAGITVRMVTGDNIETAKNIAIQCNIIRRGEEMQPHIAIEGPDFRALPRADLLDYVKNMRVMARSSPLDKQILVEALQELGEIVAVTGDGTNDGPALARANVGFAMNSGTDVAKEASAIILMDDNFASIVKAILWGRNVMDSVRKFICLQLTINIVAVTTACVGAITGSGESPLTAIQLLWVNLVMDAFAALSLATDHPTPDMLDRKPYGKKPKIITVTMWKHIIGMSIYQLIILFIVLYGAQYITNGKIILDSKEHLSLMFNLFIFLQLGNEFNCRRIYDEHNVFQNIHKSHIFLGIMAGTIGMQIILVELAGDFVQTYPLNVGEWFTCIGLGVSCLPVDQIFRFIPIRDKDVDPVQPPPPPPVAPGVSSGIARSLARRALDTDHADDPTTRSMRSGDVPNVRVVHRDDQGNDVLVVPQAKPNYTSLRYNKEAMSVLREKEELAEELKRVKAELAALKGGGVASGGAVPATSSSGKGVGKFGAGSRNDTPDERRVQEVARPKKEPTAAARAESGRRAPATPDGGKKDGEYSYYSDDDFDDDNDRFESPQRRRRSGHGWHDSAGDRAPAPEEANLRTAPAPAPARGGNGGGDENDYSYYSDEDN